MSLLLLFAGSGPQAPAPPATGPICGSIEVPVIPFSLLNMTKVSGVIDAAILDKILSPSIEPTGIVIAHIKPSGVIVKCED